MSGEKLLEAINVDWSNDGEKRGVILDGAKSRRVGKLVCWRSWHRRQVKRDES